jgi:hypothetical protein
VKIVAFGEDPVDRRLGELPWRALRHVALATRWHPLLVIVEAIDQDIYERRRARP